MPNKQSNTFKLCMIVFSYVVVALVSALLGCFYGEKITFVKNLKDKVVKTDSAPIEDNSSPSTTTTPAGTTSGGNQSTVPGSSDPVTT